MITLQYLIYDIAISIDPNTEISTSFIVDTLNQSNNSITAKHITDTILYLYNNITKITIRTNNQDILITEIIK
jgi:hypothetical protein